MGLGVQTGLGGQRKGGKAEPCGRARLEPQTCRGLSGASVSPAEMLDEGREEEEMRRREKEKGGGGQGGWRGGEGEEEQGCWERLGPAGGGHSGLT